MPRLNLTFKPSCFLALILVLLHGLAAFAIGYTGMPIYLKSLLWLLLIYSVYFQLKARVWLRHPHSVAGLVEEGKNLWRIKFANGREIQASVAADSVCLQHFILLNFKFNHKRMPCSVVVFPDSLDAKAFHLLRVTLLN